MCNEGALAAVTGFAGLAGLDEGLPSFSLPIIFLYGESLQVQQMPVTNNSAPSYTRTGLRLDPELHHGEHSGLQVRRHRNPAPRTTRAPPRAVRAMMPAD